jgi:hypothetical protein
MSYIGTRSCGLVHFAEWPIEDVRAAYFRRKITIDAVTRYQVFAKSLVCCCYGIVGSRMFLDARENGYIENCRLGVKSSSAYRVSPRPHRRAARADGPRLTAIYVQTGS